MAVLVMRLVPLPAVARHSPSAVVAKRRTYSSPFRGQLNGFRRMPALKLYHRLRPQTVREAMPYLAGLVHPLTYNPFLGQALYLGLGNPQQPADYRRAVLAGLRCTVPRPGPVSIDEPGRLDDGVLRA